MEMGSSKELPVRTKGSPPSSATRMLAPVWRILPRESREDCPRTVLRRIGKNRKAFAQKFEGAMHHFRDGIGFGMDGAGFLQLQCGFRGNGQRWPARHDIKRLRVFCEIDRFGPIDFCGLCQLIGQRSNCGKQFLVAQPMGHNCRTCHQRYNEGFRRGNAQFRPCMERQANISGMGGRRILHIDQRHRQGACGLRAASCSATMSGLFPDCETVTHNPFLS